MNSPFLINKPKTSLEWCAGETRLNEWLWPARIELGQRPPGVLDQFFHRPASVVDHLKWMVFVPPLGALKIRIDERREEKASHRAHDFSNERQHRSSVRHIKMSKHREQPDHVET